MHVLFFNFVLMQKEIIDFEEDRLLEEWDIEFAHWIRNGPAYRAYNRYIMLKKEKKLMAQAEMTK